MSATLDQLLRNCHFVCASGTEEIWAPAQIPEFSERQLYLMLEGVSNLGGHRLMKHILRAHEQRQVARKCLQREVHTKGASSKTIWEPIKSCHA